MKLNFAIILAGLVANSAAAPLQFSSTGSYPGHAVQSIDNDNSQVQPGNSVSFPGSQSTYQQRRSDSPNNNNNDAVQAASAPAKGGDSTSIQNNSGSKANSTEGGAQISDSSATGASIQQSVSQGDDDDDNDNGNDKASHDKSPTPAPAPAPDSDSDSFGVLSNIGSGQTTGDWPHPPHHHHHNWNATAPVNGTTAGAVSGGNNSAKGSKGAVSGTDNSVAPENQGAVSGHGNKVDRRMAASSYGYGYYYPIPPQYAGAGQQGSADAFGGESHQSEYNAPVVSGSGNSVTTGGPQSAQNSAQGGGVTESLTQRLGMPQRRDMISDDVEQLLQSNDLTKNVHALQSNGVERRQYGGAAFGAQGASADGAGGVSHQSQKNCGVISGYGNSVTEGGQQGAQNIGFGGHTTQTGTQQYRRQWYGYGAESAAQGAGQGASADGQGGHSVQDEINCGVVSGYGNSVTEGGPQGASNNGQGGQTKQSLSQLLHARQYAPSPYGYGGYYPSQSNNVATMNSDASAHGGHSFQHEDNHANVDGYGNSVTEGGAQISNNSAQGGNTAQSLTQLNQEPQQGYYYPYPSDSYQGASQGSDASAHGGPAFQSENNYANVNGNGNSVTQGGMQQADGQAYGGNTQSSLSQLTGDFQH